MYGIPSDARLVVEFHLEDKNIREIFPDLGIRWSKYINGIKANIGSIYCIHVEVDYFLKIIPGEGHNTEGRILRDLQLPRGYWDSGAKMDVFITFIVIEVVFLS